MVYNIDKSRVKNGEKAQENHVAYAAWAFPANLQQTNTKD